MANWKMRNHDMWAIFYVYVNQKNQVKRQVTMYDNNELEGKLGKYDSKLLFKGQINEFNQVGKYYAHCLLKPKTTPFKRFLKRLSSI